MSSEREIIKNANFPLKIISLYLFMIP